MKTAARRSPNAWSYATRDDPGSARLFVVADLPESEFSQLLRRLRRLFDGTDENPHITLRGPYRETPAVRALQSIEARLASGPILLSGVGRFEVNRRHIVYLKVSGAGISRTWWKPDYPRAVFGFHPHVTLFAGDDKARADTIYWFLRKTTLECLFERVSLRVHTQRHDDLFAGIAATTEVAAAPPRAGFTSLLREAQAIVIGRQHE